MGGGSKKGGKSTPAADAQARIAEQLIRQTDPVRSALIGRSAQFLGASPGMGNVQATSSTTLGVPVVAQGGGVIGNALRQIQRNATPVATPIAPTTGPTGMEMVTASPTFQAFRDTANRQFASARDAAISRLPGGGALTEALVGLEGQRAATLTQGAGSIFEDELSRAMALGTGLTGTSMNSLGQAGAIQAQMAANRAQLISSKSESLGRGAGAFLGSK